MGTGVYKQPNGLLAMFSSISDNVWAWNCTPEDAWTLLVFHSRFSVSAAVESISGALNPESLYRHSPYSWEDRLEVVERIHGKERVEELRRETEEPHEHPTFAQPLWSTLKGLRLGVVGSTEPHPEWSDLSTYLYELPGKDQADVLRQWHKMTGGTHLNDEPSEVSMTCRMPHPHRGKLWEALRSLLIENEKKGRSPSDNATDVLYLMNHFQPADDT